MSQSDEMMSSSPMEIHLQQEIMPNIMITQSSVELVTDAIEENKKALWEGLAPSLDVLIDKFQLPREKDPHITDIEYFEQAVQTMYAQNMAVKAQNPEAVKWSIWPTVASETGAANCSLGSQVFLRLLSSAGYQVEYGTPGPLTHSVAFAKSGDDYYYLDPTNGIVEKVAESTDVDGIKVHSMKTDKFECPFEAVPAFPPESSVVATISNLQALQSENERNVHSDFVESLATKLNMTESRNYTQWVTSNLFPEWDTLKRSDYWKEETKKVSEKLVK